MSEQELCYDLTVFSAVFTEYSHFFLFLIKESLLCFLRQFFIYII